MLQLENKIFKLFLLNFHSFFQTVTDLKKYDSCLILE